MSRYSTRLGFDTAGLISFNKLAFGAAVFLAVGCVALVFKTVVVARTKKSKPTIPALPQSTAFQRAVVLSRDFPKDLPNEVQLQLYGLYKQSTCGPPATENAPWEPIARAKYFAWDLYRDMSADRAQVLYVALVDRVCEVVAMANNGETLQPQRQQNMTMGPKVSTMAPQEFSPVIERGAAEQAQLRVFDLICKDFTNLNDDTLAFNADVLVQRDEEQRTLLHWAVDSDNVDAVKFLLGKIAVEVDAKDTDGLTPLGYAASMDMEEICLVLISVGHANPMIAGNNETASQLCRRNAQLKQLLQRAEQGREIE